MIIIINNYLLMIIIINNYLLIIIKLYDLFIEYYVAPVTFKGHRDRAFRAY